MVAGDSACCAHGYAAACDSGDGAVYAVAAASESEGVAACGGSKCGV